jgi:RNA-binding protein
MSEPVSPLAPLGNAMVRDLKSRAQRLDAVLKVGKAGLTDAFFKSLDQALADHELVKVKFADHKDQRKVLAPQLAERSGSHLVTLIGNVVVLFRRRSTAPVTPAGEA